MDKNAAYPKAVAEMKKDGGAVALLTAAAGEILAPKRQTADPAGTWLWQLLDGPTNAGGLRGNGNDQEGSGSKHQRQRHQDPGRVHRRTVPSGRPKRHLILSKMISDQR